MSFWRSLPWKFFLALVVLKIVFWQLSLFEHFCACSCEDVSCPRVFENDIMSLLALKICILLLIIVIWKRFKKSWKSSWKMERLKFQNLWFVKMKKKFDFTFYLLLERISQMNFIYPCIMQTLRFNNFNFFGKSNWNFSGNPSTNVSNSTLYVRNSIIQKIFYVSIHSLKTKRVRMKTCLQCFHSSLRYSATYFHLRLKCCLWTVASGLFKI